MKIAIIGTGYVGLPSGVGFAELGNEVVCIDKIAEKIEVLKAGRLTLFEEGLCELFKKNTASGRLKFTTSMREGVRGADVVLIAVGTPPDPVTKAADLSFVYAAAEEMAECLDGYTVICDKSTVPVGTGDRVERLIREKNPQAEFDVVSLPEFLREGFAVHDFFNPDRVVIGTESERARAVLKKLYAPMAGKTQLLCVKRRSAEIIKYASNSFLAMKIHYINELANFCEHAGADIRDVALGIGLDSRIGPKFLNPGPGFGGSCFPKDTLAMDYMAREVGVDLTLIQSAISGNVLRKKLMARRILKAASGVSKPRIAVLGIAFKGGTDDCRESPAVDIVRELLLLGADNVVIFDPKAMDNAKKIFGDKVSFAPDAYAALEGADVCAVLTEWKEFKDLDLARAKELMRRPVLEDLRNMLDPKKAQSLGFAYDCIGAAQGEKPAL